MRAAVEIIGWAISATNIIAAIYIILKHFRVSKRKTMLIVALLLGSVCSAQLKQKVMVSYSPYEQYKIGLSAPLRLPSLSVKSGMSYTWRFLTADFDNTFWVGDGRGATFTPVQSKFDIGLEAEYRKIKLRIDHTCWHPVSSWNTQINGIYGGRTKISLSYGY